MIESLNQLKEEFARRAQALGLEAPCISGGNIHANVAIVGEAPGEHETAKGTPFVGMSGQKFWDAMRKHNITRLNTYHTNVCKRQVSFGNDKRMPINKHELEHWHTLLMWELSQLPNLEYIVILGNFALKALTGQEGITSWRGSVLDAQIVTMQSTRSVKAVCTYNPAMVIREPKLEITFMFDLGKLPKIMNGMWVEVPVKSILNPSFSDAMDYMDMLTKADAPIALDIETLSNETACIGLANNGDEGMCINFLTLSEERKRISQFTFEEERKLRKRINQFTQAEDNQFICQNGMFDSSWLLFKDRIRLKPLFQDTMLQHHTLYPQLPHNLGYLTTQYTTRPYYKGEKDEWREKNGSIDNYWHYNVQDCCNTWIAAQAMHQELIANSLDKFFYEHVMRAQPHLINMVVGGIKVDMGLRESFKENVEKRVSQLLEEFHAAVHEAVGDPEYTPNPKSPKQMTDLYFSKLKLVGRGVSTDAENRERMYKHPATKESARKVLRAVGAYAEEHKFFSTYVTAGIDDDGRMRCTYNQTGVQSAPGRLSSSGMLWRNAEGVESGMNLQNQPERAHPLYIADEGYALCYFDLSQAEARVVGWYAKIDSWIEQFERARVDGSYDAHRALASDMFGIAYNDVPTKDRESDGSVTVRYIAKRCRHGLNYRMGPDRLSTVTGLSMREAEIAYRKYHQITPELQRWWASLESEVRTTRTLFNAYGRRFVVLERLSTDALESIVAFKPQSTVGDKVVRVIYQCESDPRWPANARMVLNIHDALIALAPKHLAQRCLSIMKKYAEEPIYINGMELIIPADTKISYPNERGFHSWGSMKHIDIEAAK